MSSEYRFWLRERGRSRNKWHVSMVYHPGEPHRGYPHTDGTACGLYLRNISASEYQTQELPNGTLPTDASGTCMHCLRWTETENRKDELAQAGTKLRQEVQAVR